MDYSKTLAEIFADAVNPSLDRLWQQSVNDAPEADIFPKVWETITSLRSAARLLALQQADGLLRFLFKICHHDYKHFRGQGDPHNLRSRTHLDGGGECYLYENCGFTLIQHPGSKDPDDFTLREQWPRRAGPYGDYIE